MRWFGIRKAKIGPELRTRLERLGVQVCQQIVACHEDNDWRLKPNKFLTAGPTALSKDPILDSMNVLQEHSILGWLTEQYDRAERKETWSITMEVAITVFVFFEL